MQQYLSLLKVPGREANYITGPIQFCYSNDSEPQVEVSVVRKVDNAVYWMNLSNVQRNWFPSNIYALQDHDDLRGTLPISFEKLGPVR